MVSHSKGMFLATVVIFALMWNNPQGVINCLEIVSDHESEPSGDGMLNAMKSATTEEPKTRPCNSCEMEKCRRHCKGTCRPCQYNFCHVDEGEYSCKCLRNPPAVTTISTLLEEDGEAEERRRRSIGEQRSKRIPRYVPPRRGKRVRNCNRQ